MAGQTPNKFGVTVGGNADGRTDAEQVRCYGGAAGNVSGIPADNRSCAM